MHGWSEFHYSSENRRLFGCRNMSMSSDNITKAKILLWLRPWLLVLSRVERTAHDWMIERRNIGQLFILEDSQW
jgi:hypothetical protein